MKSQMHQIVCALNCKLLHSEDRRQRNEFADKITHRRYTYFSFQSAPNFLIKTHMFLCIKSMSKAATAAIFFGSKSQLRFQFERGSEYDI